MQLFSSFTCAGVLLLAGAAASEIRFAPPVDITVGNKFFKEIELNLARESLWPNAPIPLVGDVSPGFGDLDCDGVRDLVAGVRDSRTILFFRNAGTDAAPQYESFRFLHEGPDSVLLDVPPT